MADHKLLLDTITDSHDFNFANIVLPRILDIGGALAANTTIFIAGRGTEPIIIGSFFFFQ